MSKRCAAAVLHRWLLLRVAAPAAAQDFYKGKTINILAGFSPGGGYDINARVLARHMGRHIPGNPTMVVQNMPGAGSLNAVHYLDNTAAKDGTVLNTFNFGAIGEARLSPGQDQDRFPQVQLDRQHQPGPHGLLRLARARREDAGRAQGAAEGALRLDRRRLVVRPQPAHHEEHLRREAAAGRRLSRQRRAAHRDRARRARRRLRRLVEHSGRVDRGQEDQSGDPLVAGDRARHAAGRAVHRSRSRRTSARARSCSCCSPPTSSGGRSWRRRRCRPSA